jgi:hypothetical protein
MIATRLPRAWRAVRIGEVQPLSAILPAVLRHYGLRLPPESIVLSGNAPRTSCDGDDSTAASCLTLAAASAQQCGL